LTEAVPALLRLARVPKEIGQLVARDSAPAVRRKIRKKCLGFPWKPNRLGTIAVKLAEQFDFDKVGHRNS
jgi:hypothetical protein